MEGSKEDERDWPEECGAHFFQEGWGESRSIFGSMKQ